jgi:DNA recombination protein RmuC
MNSSNEILFLVIGIVFGLFAGGAVCFLLFGRKSANQTDEKAKQQYEKEITRLETSLIHANNEIEEKKRAGIQKERESSEITRKFNETLRNLSVAEERVQNISSECERLAEKASRQETELSSIRENLAQVTANASALEHNLAEQRRQNNLKELQVHELNDLNNRLNSENATLLANLNANEGKLATQKAEIEDIREKSHLEFENIANRLLEAKSERFTEANRVNIENILLPLKSDINLFKTKVEETYEKESQQRFSLEKEVKALIEQTDKVSNEANNLAAALKGQAKKQGDWGEMILERILETNGLVRGREYDVQHPIKNEDGDQQYLDVIVHLPDNRKLVIDSKVTLVAYDRYCSSETDEDRSRCLKDHIHALSTHIDQLSGKKYDQMDASPDFVLLFVPIEPAYMMAVQNDSELWARAYAKRILLISPTNLMGAVKMVSDLWKRDQQSKNVLEIARQGEKLYDKFIGFLNSMDDIGKHIINAQESFNKALGQLKQGRGNLVSRAEKLKHLGIKSSKSIPATMMNYEADEDEFVLEIPAENAKTHNN